MISPASILSSQSGAGVPGSSGLGDRIPHAAYSRAASAKPGRGNEHVTGYNRASRAVSSVGRAPARQAGGHWFEPSTAHLGKPRISGVFAFRDGNASRAMLARCSHRALDRERALAVARRPRSAGASAKAAVLALLVEVYRFAATLGRFLALLVVRRSRSSRSSAGVSALQSGAHREVPVR
jgi:hypothetical protein